MEIKTMTWVCFTAMHVFLSPTSARGQTVPLKTPGRPQSSEKEVQTRTSKAKEEEEETRPLSLCEADVVVHSGETKEVGGGVVSATLYLFHDGGLRFIHIKALFNNDISDTKTRNTSDLCLDGRTTTEWHKISVDAFDRDSHKVLRISANCTKPVEEQLEHKTSLYSYKDFRILAEGFSYWRNTTWPLGCPPFRPRTAEQRKVTIGLVVLLATIIVVTNAILIVVVEKKWRDGELDNLCCCHQSGSQE
ncbi:uncharacterized protein [Macrobrachium rosenbergii]|uniref:uncharacterized protein n=1 Tax=Macrobrachium rosenbergii TaxID=79674 RepID=UPI0034D51CC1